MTCLSAGDIARLIAGDYSSADVLTHVDGCEACRLAVAAAVRAARSSDITPSRQATEPATGITTTLPRGTLVDRYCIEGCLGAGGMGIVYRARDTELDRLVALKLVRPQASAEAIAQRLRRESRLQARAAHRSVITVYDVGRDDKQVYVAMELIAGATLKQWLETPRSWREILDVFCEAAEGLGAAHAAGLVHRDFKPDNVLVELRDGRVTRVLVSDFGVARAIEQTDPIAPRTSSAELGVTAAGAIIGTPAYMSPEQLEAVAVDARADVFSFCAALWEALYRQRPFRGATLAALQAAFETPPRPPGRTAVPGWIADALRRGLAVDRDKRTARITQLIEDLDWRRRGRRRRFIATGILVAFAIAGGAAGWGLTRESPPPSACAVAAHVGDDVARTGRELAAVLEPTTPALADYWRSATERYATSWNRLRTNACALMSESQVRCVDRLGEEMVAALDAARRADAVRRGDMLRALAGEAVPHECMSAAATSLLAIHPDDERVRGARHAIRAASGACWRDHDQARAQIAALQPAIAIAGFEPVRIEVAGLEAHCLGDPFQPDYPIATRRVAQDAERVGEFKVAASMWIAATQGVGVDSERLLAADNALNRAGNPPLARALWYLTRASANAGSQPRSARADLRLAQATREIAGAPYDPAFDAALGSVLFNVGDFEQAERHLSHAKATGLQFGFAGEEMIRLRAMLARALAANDKLDAANAELSDLLAGVDPRRPLPNTALVSAIYMYATIVVDTNPREALARLQRWAAALDVTLEHDALLRGHIEDTKAFALTLLERYQEAELSARRALEIMVSRLGASAENTAETRLLLARILFRRDKLGEAEEVTRRAIADLAQNDGEDAPVVAQARLVLAIYLIQRGRTDEARPLAEQALRVYEHTQALDIGERGEARWALARALAATDPARERALTEGAIADFTASGSADKAQLAAARARLRALDRAPAERVSR